MPLDRPANIDEQAHGQEILDTSFEGQLQDALRDERKTIVTRIPFEVLQKQLHDTNRFYFDLDGTLLPPGTTMMDDYTLRMLRLIIDNGGHVTFLTGKPLVEVEKLVASMPEDLREKVAILYEKGAYRYSKADPAERLLTSEAVEEEIVSLGRECFEEWADIIGTRHSVKLSRAGSGAHKSVLSIDLDRPGAVLADNDPERMSAKIDPKNKRLVRDVIATLRELIAAKRRNFDFHVTDLGNANLEIEVVDIEKGSAIARLERDKNAEDHGRAMVMDDSGNGELMFRVGRFLPHVTNALVYHDTTPEAMLPLADIAVAGKAQGAHILEKVAQAKGDTHDLIVVSNTPSLDRDAKTNEFINRMGAPVAIGGVVRGMRRALWIYPKQFRGDGTVDDFSDYPDPLLRGKFVPVGIDADEYDSQYNRISNTDWWFWCHPDSFPDAIEQQDPVHMTRYEGVSARIGDKLAERVTNGDTTHVSVHDFQVLPSAMLFRQRHADKQNVRFHIFWHIPVPTIEQSKRLPAQEVARRLRWFEAYDQVAFHTEEYKNNYLALCTAYAELGVRPAKSVLVQPISIDVDALRDNAIEVANANDFRFTKTEINDFLQLGLPEAERDELIMAPPERADPIKGGSDRLAALLHIAKTQPHLLDGKRFLEFILPSRLDSRVYKENFDGMLELHDQINHILGRQAVFNCGRLDDRREVAAAMHRADKAMFTSRDDGFNMTIPEMLVVWEITRLIKPKIRRLFATDRTGFVLSLKEHGLLVPGKEAIPVFPSAARNREAFRGAVRLLLEDKLPQPRYDVLSMYLSRYTLQKWIDRNVREHVRSSFSHGIIEATA